MRNRRSSSDALTIAADAARELQRCLSALDETALAKELGSPEHEYLLKHGGKSLAQLDRVLRLMSPQRYGAVGLTLGRADGIAKFFAFNFIASPKLPLAELSKKPFWGSGVYAIYYHGKKEPAYAPISGTETPIYVGKADPTNAFAETIEAQGKVLFKRVKFHAGNIAKTGFDLRDFRYRTATIQSGMQASVEEFMLRLFRPIWNRSVGVMHGLGKHGDSPTTRANKRSPWDTMHPGRKWAEGTTKNQAERHEIIARIEAHFKSHQVIRDKVKLFEKLALR